MTGLRHRVLLTLLPLLLVARAVHTQTTGTVHIAYDPIILNVCTSERSKRAFRVIENAAHFAAGAFRKVRVT